MGVQVEAQVVSSALARVQPEDHETTSSDLVRTQQDSQAVPSAAPRTAAWPLADPALTQEILDVLQSAIHVKLAKKGANEATKAVSRNNAELVLLAADTIPLSIVLHLQPLCELKNTPYVFVPSKLQLGRACGVSRPAIAACFLHNEASDLAPQIQRLRDKVERLAM